MKKSFFSLVIMLSVAFMACNQGNQNSANNSDSTQTANLKSGNLKLQIYYFHATHRCATCNSIEANVKKVLEENFKEQLAQGMIDLKVLCVDDAASKALAEKYEAAGAALHLVKIENGVEKDNDLTEYAFSYSRNEPDFFLKGMQDTISYFLR